MTKKKQFSDSGARYKAPRTEYSYQLCEELICTSPEGLTEDVEVIEDFVW
ncbi:MAG: hypothetical protein IKH11_02315 [Bacteroidales bacterium]|nr:hypothetical protein [Bacteroidales bacterium]